MGGWWGFRDEPGIPKSLRPRSKGAVPGRCGLEKPHQSPKAYLVPPFSWGGCGQRWRSLPLLGDFGVLWKLNVSAHTF